MAWHTIRTFLSGPKLRTKSEQTGKRKAVSKSTSFCFARLHLILEKEKCPEVRILFLPLIWTLPWHVFTILILVNQNSFSFNLHCSLHKDIRIGCEQVDTHLRHHIFYFLNGNVCACALMTNILNTKLYECVYNLCSRSFLFSHAVFMFRVIYCRAEICVVSTINIVSFIFLTFYVFQK